MQYNILNIIHRLNRRWPHNLNELQPIKSKLQNACGNFKSHDVLLMRTIVK